MMTVGSLFTGIGGIDLGLERAGFRIEWHSEIEPYACRVLAKNWPDVPNLGDIRTIQWETVPYVDVIAGGYPCQPFSTAGTRQGADDPRHLWPYMAAAIRRVRPRFALLENVAAHLTLGFGTVLGDLAALGYDAEWDCIPAAAVGAPHLRDRLFVIATRRNMADPGCPRLQGWNRPENPRRKSADRFGSPPLRWPSEPGVDRMANGVPHRVDRLRGLGNAVVPAVAEHVGRIIVSMS